MTKNKITTIEGLAEMIQRTMARKEDVQALDKKVQALDMKVTTGFDRLYTRTSIVVPSRSRGRRGGIRGWECWFSRRADLPLRAPVAIHW